MRFVIEELASGQFVILDLQEGKLVRYLTPTWTDGAWPGEYSSRRRARQVIAELLAAELAKV